MDLFTPAETAANYSLAGAAKTRSPAWRLLLLGILAGSLIAMGGAVTNTAGHSLTNVGAARVVSGLLFPFGLAMVVLTGGELFTGNTLITISVLDRRATLAGMLRNWVLVYAGNTVGALLTAAGCAFSGQLDYSAGGLALFTMKLAAGKCGLSFGHAVLLGVMCNVLVTLGVLLSLSAKDLPGRVLGAYLPVAFFVICGFEHSIANLYYVPAGLFAKSVPAYAALAAEAGLDLSGLTWGGFLLHNLLPVTLGNILGGVAVGGLFWACWLRKGEERMSDLDAYLRFIQEAEGLKSVTRTSWTAAGRRESTAEHSWRLALLAWAMLDFYPDLDKGRVLMLCLVHDLGERYGGDLCAADLPDPGEKEAMERAGIEQLFSLLPQGKGAEFRALWEEYEAAETPEAKLVKALDKAETILQHNQGRMPKDFDYDFNLDYGKAWFQGDPVLEELRRILDDGTRERMEGLNGG